MFFWCNFSIWDIFLMDHFKNVLGTIGINASFRSTHRRSKKKWWSDASMPSLGTASFGRAYQKISKIGKWKPGISCLSLAKKFRSLFNLPEPLKSLHGIEQLTLELQGNSVYGPRVPHTVGEDAAIHFEIQQVLFVARVDVFHMH